jgi:Domain of unknown function (DUF4124)
MRIIPSTLAFTLMTVVCAVAFSAAVYRWVDENGVVHYSDQPHENAEKVQVAPPQTYSAPPVQPRQADSAPPPVSNVYQSCAVVSPANDQTFANAYSVSTVVQVSPAPSNGDGVVLLLDGAPLRNFPRAGGAYTISPVDRGTHSLQALVEDSSGKVLCQSPSITFNVTQPSVLNPANPNFKH